MTITGYGSLHYLQRGSVESKWLRLKLPGEYITEADMFFTASPDSKLKTYEYWYIASDQIRGSAPAASPADIPTGAVHVWVKPIAPWGDSGLIEVWVGVWESYLIALGVRGPDWKPGPACHRWAPMVNTVKASLCLPTHGAFKTCGWHDHIGTSPILDLAIQDRLSPIST